jgi:hypothetical protein
LRSTPSRVLALRATSGRLVDPDVRLGVEQRPERAGDVRGKQPDRQLGIRLLCRVEAVKHLDVLVADEQLLRFRTGDRVEKRRLVALVDTSSGRAVGGSDRFPC